MLLPRDLTIKPPSQPDSSPSESKGQPVGASSTSTSTPIRANELNPSQSNRLLNQLVNTWAKVESSQSLSPEQNQALIQQTTNTKPNITVTEQLQRSLQQLLNAQGNQQEQTAQLKFQLVKLNTQQGLLSILSTQTYSKGMDVLISQGPNGNIQLQSANTGFSLLNMAAQLKASIQTALKLPIDWAAQSPLSKQLNVPAIPSSTLNSQTSITPKTVQQAVQNSGQYFEQNLVQALKQSLGKSEGLALNQGNVPEAMKTAIQNLVKESSNQILQASKQEEKASQTANSSQLSQKMSDISQQIKQWSQQFSERLQGSQTSIESKQATPILSTDKVITVTPSDLFQNLPSAVKTVLQQDQKLWLQTSQQQLTNAFSQHILQNKDAFIPTWSNLIGQVKTPLDLSNWLNILVTPKTNPNQGGLNLWPSNLSSQSQLNQTVSLLLANTPNDEQHHFQNQVLRQLQTISQSLMKIQYEQIQNRLQPPQGDMNNAQFSMPYMHQQQLQWAEIEYESKNTQTDNKEKTTGWHLILRFAQNTPEAFAIESQLKQEQAQLTLWATDTVQLKKLHGEIPLLKEKLIQAGFKVDAITSKHGSPASLKKPLQQSLVDVRT